MSLAEIAIDFLKQRPGQKFTAREIAEQIPQKYSDFYEERKSRSPKATDAELYKRLRRDIRRHVKRKQEQCPELKTIEGWPRKYYYSEKSDAYEVEAVENIPVPSSNNNNTYISERDMYPLLSDYLTEEFEIYSQRINEGRSSNLQGQGGNLWLHPDLVGIEDLGIEWKQEVQDCAKKHFKNRCRLWSFEVKQSLSWSNVRKSFFQTVSNSSWANVSYLVTAEIRGTDIIKELQMLSAAHGIGLIKLITDKPEESQILIPAHERLEIDWGMVNRLATANSDFMEYVKQVTKFYEDGKLPPVD